MSYSSDAVEGFLFAIGKACASMPLNETVRLLERDQSAALVLRETLESMGQTKFKNLTNSSKQSMTAIALYAGDGIVTKIIPSGSLGQAKGVIYHLPAITTMHVETESSSFVIKTYPYVSPSGVTQEDVNDFGKIIGRVGMEFNTNDGMPKNVHRLPNLESAMIGIDSDMYHYGNGGSLITDEMRVAWHQFIYDLYPVYEHRQIPEQTESTNFDFISIHDITKEQLSFDVSAFSKNFSRRRGAAGEGSSGKQGQAPDNDIFFEM